MNTTHTSPAPNRGRMRVLHVIHGYPPLYMAGSEVYTRALARALARKLDVAVFSRCQNPFAPAYEITDSEEEGIFVRRINRPGREYTFEQRYRDPATEQAFVAMCRTFRPDVVHFGHFSHLSSELAPIAKERFKLPTVFTAHDHWLGCYRGQLMTPELERCSGPNAEACLACAHAQYGDAASPAMIEARRRQIRRVLANLDLILCPSRSLERFFLDALKCPPSKVRFSPYGIDGARIRYRRRRGNTAPLTFGFLGRIIPVKGVDVLIRAFKAVRGRARLEIHGQPGSTRPFLEALVAGDERIALMGGYKNDAVGAVLDRLDVLVVPSIWPENAPLVIQEAQLAGLPVVASAIGGMLELVRHGQDGYHVPPGDPSALTERLQAIVDDPRALERLEVDPNRVRTIDDDARSCIAHYRRLASPRRLTIVTNPGLCNMSCPMCDTHSIHAPETKKELAKLPMLSWDVVEKTVRDLARLGLEELIPSTMGEPLLWPSFDRLLALLEELGLRLNLTTNGSFPRGGVTRWAPKLLPVLSDLKVSLNAIDPRINERVMCGARTEKQIANVEAFVRARERWREQHGRAPTITIQATFMETNLEALPDLLRWAIRTGVDRFKGHHLWVTWPQLERESLRRNTEAASRWNRMVEILHALAAEQRGPGGRTIRLENVRPLDLSAPAGPEPESECPFLGREAWIEADGSFEICCCPSNKRKLFGDFGSVHEQPLARLWASNRYRKFIAGWGNHPNCRECNMRRPRTKENAQ